MWESEGTCKKEFVWDIVPLQGLMIAQATILALLACSLMGRAKGFLKTRFLISISGTRPVVRPHLPECGG